MSSIAQAWVRKVVNKKVREKIWYVRTLLRYRGDMVAAKNAQELEFWQRYKLSQGGRLWNDHYVTLFTTAFGLDESFYEDKSVLDVGCGPCGSLEWADLASRRVGLDPLANDYAVLRASPQKMEYSNARSEAMPFPDDDFDIITSINSLDHVDDVDATASEISRVLKPGGQFLLITEVNHGPRVTEPHNLSWNVVTRFPGLTLVESDRFAIDPSRGEDLFAGLLSDQKWDPAAGSRSSGLLRARFMKPAPRSS